MKSEAYNFEIKTLVAQFIDAFNDIVIKRYDDDKNVKDKIHCNFIYSPKTRTLHDIVNKAKHIKLPIISISTSSIRRNPNRVFNKLNGPTYNQGASETGFSRPLQPVPIDIGINMSIITRFQSDMDQIISNFVPYNDPYITISWKAPYTNHEIRSIVKWSGDISLEYPTDIAPNTPYRAIGNTSFVIEGWIYKDVSEPAGKIYKIDTSFTAVSSLNAKYDTLVALSDQYNTDTFILSGRPQVITSNPWLTIPCVSDKSIVIDGTFFDTLCSLYVSGSEGLFSDVSIFNPASANVKISAMYPEFSGVEIDNWTTYSDSKLSFIMPSAVSAGYVDVIAFNEAGYGKLTIDSVRPTLNPYVSGTVAYDEYVEYQHPSVSGIQVLPYYGNCT
jgi:hypothetical protein